VIVAEDMHMVRGALVALLDRESDIEVVAEVAIGTDVLPAVRNFRPDVAVIDIDLPGLDGLTAATQIHEQVPECRTLILTSHGRPGTLRRALLAKVSGFILKDAPARQLADAVRVVALGGRVIDSELALDAWNWPDCPLTRRELEVLQMAAHGNGVAEIAGKLYLTTGTVRNYLRTIAGKLNARNRVDAIRIAQEAEWL
jgi:two-component system response regulator DesR